MGLFPDGPPASGPNSPKIKKKLFSLNRSNSSCGASGSFKNNDNSKISSSSTPKTGMQQMSTSWEFIR